MTTQAAAARGSRPGLRCFTKLTCFATLLLIFAGGLVKSYEAGLSVPDWPNTYGHNLFLFPPSLWKGNIFYEHTHRLIASAVGLLTLIQAVWLAFAEPRRWVKVLGWTALVAVIVQGVLGGLTVLFLLPALISVAHGVLAQTFFAITIILAYSQSRERNEREREPGVPSAAWAVLTAGLIYAQLILGTVMRHTESGLAIPDFPTMGGRWLPVFNAETLAWINNWRFHFAFEVGKDLPAVTLGQVLIHFAHRAGAVAVTLAIVVLAMRILREGRVAGRARNALYALLALVMVQFSLGALTVWTHKAPNITSFHVVTGAVLLGANVLLALRLLPLTLR